MVCEDCKPLIERLEKAEKRIEELKKKLLSHENAHTPNSKLRFPPRILNENNKSSGQKKGHIGITRQRPDPTFRVEVIEEICPHCESKLDKPYKQISKVIEDIPEPQPIEVTEYLINHYRCSCCGNEIVANSKIPEQSRFGENTLAHVTLLKFEDRLPLKKVCSTLSRQFGLDICSATVLDITRRVSDRLQTYYNRIKYSLRISKSVNVDETGIRVGGLNFYIWTFTTKKHTLYVIRKSRGKKVIEEVLGKNYKGVIGCDGWTSYPSYTNNIQRCWAHLLREARYLADQYDTAKSLNLGLKNIFKKAKSKKPPNKDNLIFEMEQWIEYAKCYKELRKFAIKIKNGIEHWFTFIGKGYVEPTNNRAERALRELIVQRKIMGTLRNKKGTTIMERITTCIATWKQKELNPFNELKAHLC
jgi:transposase